MADVVLPYNSQASPAGVQNSQAGTSLVTSYGTPVRTNVKEIRPGVYPPGHLYNTSRHFTFILNNDISATREKTTVVLNVNPEDFAIDEPYRVSPVQTMDAPFVDVWGVGIRKLSLRGHTGWKTQAVDNQLQDGYDNFFAFKDSIIGRYFELRNKYQASFSQDELNRKVSLQLVDALNNKTYELIPEYFKFLKNKSRPHIFMYDVMFVIVGDSDNPVNTNNVQDYLSEIKKNKIKEIPKVLKNLHDAFSKIGINIPTDGNFGDMITRLSNFGKNVTTKLSVILQDKEDISNALFSLTSGIHSIVGAVTSSLGSLLSFGDLIAVPLPLVMSIWDLKNLYGQLACVLAEIKQGSTYSYTGLFDSAACSSMYGIDGSELTKAANSFESLRAKDTNLQNTQNAQVISQVSIALAKELSKIDTTLSLVTGK